MKTFNAIGSILLVLSLSLFFGCGDSSSGGSGGAPSATLNEENVNDFVRKISNEIGCTYTEENPGRAVSLQGMLPLQMLSIVAKATNIQDKFDGSHTLDLRALREVETTSGDCGGYMVATTNEDTGSMTFEFDEYCNGELTGAQTVIDGEARVTMEQGSDDSIVINASTTKPITIKTVNPETDEKVDVTISLTGGKVTITGDLFENPNISLRASSGYITDNVTGEKYSGSNLSATLAGDAVEFAATFTDPELGKVTVSGVVEVDADSGTGTGTITVKGAGDTKAVFKTTEQEAVFSVTTNGEPAGTLDCSQIDTSIADDYL